NPYLEFRLERLSRMHNDLNAIKRKLFSDTPISRHKIQNDQEEIKKRQGQKIEFQSEDIKELEQETKQTWKPEEVQPLNTKEWKDEIKQTWKPEEVQPPKMKEWDNETKQPRKAELVRPILHSIETVSKRHAEKWAANTAKATVEPPPPLNKSLM